jgi:glycerate dehydrogenase
MFNKELFRKMKPSSMLINTSRGLVINEEELAQALKEGLISGAGLDVMCQEPPEKDNPLFGLKNCLISPHQAWATQAARKRLLDGIISNIRSFQQNKPSGIM